MSASLEAEVFRLVVYGEAAPAGSKRAVRAGSGHRVIDTNKRTAPWKDEVRQVAGRAREQQELELLEGPLYALFTFYRRRPKGHFLSDGESLSAEGRRRPFPDVKPDGLKLARAVEDALSGIIYRDDSQIVDHRIRKRYGTPERVEVSLYDAAVMAELFGDVESADA